VVLWLKFLILLAWEVAGTFLSYVRELTMTKDAGFGIVFCEGFQQLVEGMLLFLGSCIVGYSFLIQAPFIDDAKGTMVVVPGVNTLDTLWQQRNDITVTSDVIVIAALAVFGFATGYQILDAERLVAPIGHAVYDEQFYRF
jgi:hypothetical protein